MNSEEARARAEAMILLESTPDLPLRLSDREPTEYSWCYSFGFNSAQWFETGDFLDMVPTGPMIVDKDGGDVWIAPSAPPVERWLNMHAEKHGFPPVPVPEIPSPW